MAAVREGEDEGWARFDPHPAAAGQANAMIPESGTSNRDKHADKCC